MILTDAQRFELFRTAYAELIRRPTWPTTTPPPKEGEPKKVRPPFAIACWAKELARTAADLHDREERERQEREGGGAHAMGYDTAPAEPGPGTPF